MPGADASRSRLLFKTESAFAEVPGSNPATTLLRFKSESLHHKNVTVVSDLIRSDRQRDDLVLVGVEVDGDIVTELTYGDWDWAIEAALCGTWSSNSLSNGTTNRSFLIEKGFLDIGKYLSYRGCVINTFALDISARTIVNLTFGVMGAQGFAGSTS